MAPITLGISMLSRAINQYHTQLYWAGGLLMIALAGLSLSGTMWSLPRFLRAPDTSRGDGASFFALGVFSGIASSCCAPVLAGVMTLSVLSGSAAGGVALGLAFVFGMVFPLFVMALIWDKARLGKRRLFQARLLKIRLGGRSLVTNTVNLAVAIAFAVLGIWVITLAGSTDMTGRGALPSTIGDWLATTLGPLRDRPSPPASLPPLPAPLPAAARRALAAGLGLIRPRDRRTRAHPPDPDPQPAARAPPACPPRRDTEGLPRRPAPPSTPTRRTGSGTS